MNSVNQHAVVHAYAIRITPVAYSRSSNLEWHWSWGENNKECCISHYALAAIMLIGFWELWRSRNGISFRLSQGHLTQLGKTYVSKGDQDIWLAINMPKLSLLKCFRKRFLGWGMICGSQFIKRPHGREEQRWQCSWWTGIILQTWDEGITWGWKVANGKHRINEAGGTGGHCFLQKVVFTNLRR